MSPFVSIGMSVLNCADTLEATIRSILLQRYQNWELIIIDDGSIDNSLSLIHTFNDARIRIYADGDSRGLSDRLNQTVALSAGKYFARIDGDDIAYPERLERQIVFLEDHPEVDLLGTRIIAFDENGKAIGSLPFRKTHSEICRRPWAGFYLPHPTWMGKLEWFRANPYRNVIRAEDQELLLRTFKRSNFGCLADILIGYRKRSLSLKNNLTGRYSFSAELVRNAFLTKDYYLLFGILEHAVKALIDVFAIVTRLNYRILRQWTIPVKQIEIDCWKNVWKECNISESRI